MTDLQRLQEQVAFQELTIERLNDALVKQQQQITALGEELRLAVKVMQQWRSENSIATGDSLIETHEIPPHY